jgi:hypothetical protein
VADTFWTAHRPATALQIWGGLLPWFSLDSLGHLHEVLAGDYYHEEQESVPEQTWSSAAFLTSAIRGLLGLRVQGAAHRVDFAPHLPPDWNALSVRNVAVAGSSLSMELSRSQDHMKLSIDNQGPAVTLKFSPELPFGARLRGALVGGQPVTAALLQNDQDTHASVELTLAAGKTSLTVDYDGGILIVPTRASPGVGDPSEGLRITGLSLSEATLRIELDHFISRTSTFELRTPWTIASVAGAELTPTGPGVSQFTLAGRVGEGNKRYEHATVIAKLVRP